MPFKLSLPVAWLSEEPITVLWAVSLKLAKVLLPSSTMFLHRGDWCPLLATNGRCVCVGGGRAAGSRLENS